MKIKHLLDIRNLIENSKIQGKSLSHVRKEWQLFKVTRHKDVNFEHPHHIPVKDRERIIDELIAILADLHSKICDILEGNL